MYIVVSDYTNEKADVYKSVSIDKAFKSRDDAIAFAAVSFQCFLNGMPEDEAARYEDAVKACGSDSHPRYHRLDRVGSLLGETVWQIGKTVGCWTDSFDMLQWCNWRDTLRLRRSA